MSDTEETKQCSNCKLDILSSNYTIHTVHCHRNFFLCTKCQQPVNLNQRKEHDEKSHVVIKCRDCSLELQKWELKEHIKNDCPYRKVKCQICDIEVKATEISEHENYCGSRTEKCSECGEFVMLRYKSLHVDSNHTFIKLSDEPGPSPSWQNGRRTLSNFLPGLSAKNYKPVASHKRRSSEKKSRNSESRDQKDLDDIFWDNKYEASSYKSDNGEFENKVEDLFKVKEVKKPLKLDCDDWSSLSSLKISEDRHDNIRKCKSKTAQNEVDEESDLMYAIQVSQELNSHIWTKDLNLSEDEALKNSFQSQVDNIKSYSKNVQKNMFTPRSRRKSPENAYKIFDTEDRNFLTNNEDERPQSPEPVKLPCEFCGALILAQELLSHQSGCSIYSMADSFDRRSTSRYKYSFADDIEKKIPCGICNKFFWLSALENHQLHCQRNLTKPWKNQEKINYARNMKPISSKSEPGIQNGIEPSSPRLSRVGTRSEWLSELSKPTNEGASGVRTNLNRPDSGVKVKTVKASRKNRRAPSPPT